MGRAALYKEDDIETSPIFSFPFFWSTLLARLVHRADPQAQMQRIVPRNTNPLWSRFH